MLKINNYIPIILITILAAISYHYKLHSYFSFTELKNNYKDINNYINNYKLISIMIYMLIYITVVALSIPGATFMTVCSGLLYNQYLGTLIAVISATIGASILFISASLAVKDNSVVNSNYSDSKIKKMKEGFNRNAFNYLLTLRLIPLFPFVLVNLAAALVSMPFRTFFSATLIGIIPGSFVFVSIGVAFQEIISKDEANLDIIISPKIIIALVGLGLLSSLPVVYKYLKNIRS